MSTAAALAELLPALAAKRAAVASELQRLRAEVEREAGRLGEIDVIQAAVARLMSPPDAPAPPAPPVKAEAPHRTIAAPAPIEADTSERWTPGGAQIFIEESLELLLSTYPQGLTAKHVSMHTGVPYDLCVKALHGLAKAGLIDYRRRLDKNELLALRPGAPMPTPELTDNQAGVIRFLAGRAGPDAMCKASLAEISAAGAVAKGSARQIVDTLDRKGYLRTVGRGASMAERAYRILRSWDGSDFKPPAPVPPEAPPPPALAPSPPATAAPPPPAAAPAPREPAPPPIRRPSTPPEINLSTPAPKPKPRPVEPVPPPVARVMREAAEVDLSMLVQEAEPDTGPRTVANIGARQCRWPTGKATGADQQFCGEKALSVGPYCLEHFRVSWPNAPLPEDAPAEGGRA